MKKSLKKIFENSKIIFDRVKNELNIDLEQYRNFPLFSNITNILFIQKYAVSNILKPVLICLSLYVLSFFVLHLSAFEIFIFGILGLILFALLGLFIGLILLINNLKKDLFVITQQSTELLELIYTDLCNIHHSKKLHQPLTLIFEGIMVGLVQPKVSTALNLPYVGGMMVSGVDKSIPFLIKNFKMQEEKYNLSANIENLGNKSLLKIEHFKEIINTYLERIKQEINKSFHYISVPIYLATFITGFILLVLLLILK